MQIRNTLLAIPLCLSWCDISPDIRQLQNNNTAEIMWLLGEDPNDTNRTFWKSDRVISKSNGWNCDIQHIFDRTTWEPMTTIFPPYIIDIARDTWLEVVAICEDTEDPEDI